MVTVQDYVRVRFRLTVTVRVRSTVDSQTVKDAVTAALTTTFDEQHRGLGQPLYRGEIYKVVDGVAGVENSSCAISLPWPQSGVAPADRPQAALIGAAVIALRPSPRQCLVFDATAFTVMIENYEESLA
jgi:phage-related baseplate assembly protein